MNRPPRLPVWLIATAVLPGAAAAEGHTWLDERLEAHGFVSFGWWRTWENNYLARDSTDDDGSTDLYEAALNATLRPLDRVRVGAQLFVRDLGQYENGAVRLDWAFAEVTIDPAVVVQAGRVKVPVGLYNELQDIDPARSTVFLPQSLYPVRQRDSLVFVDGGKLTGFVPLGNAGASEYAVYGGTRNIEPDSSFSASAADRLRVTTTEVDTDWTAGAMLHWHTPFDGLGLRASYVFTNHLVLSGTGQNGLVAQDTDVQVLVLSSEYEQGAWTLAGEYIHSDNDGEVRSAAPTRVVARDYDAGYLSATWHARTWLDAYAAVEYLHNEQSGIVTEGWVYVAALTMMPLRNWSLKAEYQLHDGAFGILSSDNPQGVTNTWHLLAFKTTVDF